MEVHIFSIVMDLFFAFTLHIFYLKLMGKRYKGNLIYLFGWLMCLLLWNACSYIFAEHPLINSVGGTLVNFFVLHLLYKGSVREKIIIIFIVVVFGFVAEVLAAFILSYTEIKDVHQENGRSSWWYIGNAISKIVWFMFVKVIACISHKKEETRVAWTEWLDVFLVPASSLTIFFIIIQENYYKITIPMLVVYIILLLINVLNYFVYQKMQLHAAELLDKQLLEQQNNYYRIRFEDTEKQWKILRKIKHDMCNEYVLHLSYLENREYNKLKMIYSDRIGSLNNKSDFIETGNIGIDAISNYKVEILRNLNVQIQKEVRIIDKVNMNHGDANILFGIFFDNAIEALEKIEEKERKIKIKIFSDETALLLKMSNTFDGIIERDDKEDIVTRKIEKNNHGIGIKTVKEIIKKYNGKVDFVINENLFEVTVFLYTAK